MPQLGGGNGGGFNLFNKQPLSVNVAAGVSAVVSAGSSAVGRGLRAKALEELIQPSVVKA